MADSPSHRRVGYVNIVPPPAMAFITPAAKEDTTSAAICTGVMARDSMAGEGSAGETNRRQASPSSPSTASREVPRGDVRTGLQQGGGVRKAARDADGPHAGGTRHLDVLRAVADVRRVGSGDAEPDERFRQGLGMRLLVARVLAAHDRGESSGETEFRDLPVDPDPASARHESGENAGRADPRKRLPGSVHETTRLDGLLRVDLEPLRVRVRPMLAGEADALVGAIPVRRVRARKDVAREVDSVRREEAAIAAEARLRGIEQGSVPVKQDGAGAGDGGRQF